MANQNINRREFIKLAAVGVAVAAGTRAVSPTKASSGAPKGKHQWVMVIDQSKCTGCEYCTRACQAHNDINPEIEWNKVVADGTVGDMQVYVPRPCMNCEKAPCVDVCPVKGSYYRDDGIVMMDYDRCIGCRYCQIACPYEARSFNWEKFEGENPMVPQWGTPEVERRPRGVPEKCSFCYQTIDRGLSLGKTPGVDPEATHAWPTILDIPRNMKWDAVNIPDPETPVGARGIGEPPVAAGACAILNALSDALGDDIYRRAPVTLDSILMALEHGRPMQDPLTAHI